MATVDVHPHQLYIRNRKLFAVQVLSENLPRIFNLFREWDIRYDVPGSLGRKDPKLTMQKVLASSVLEAGLLDYLVWGPAVPLHVVKADQFEDFYEIMEVLE